MKILHASNRLAAFLLLGVGAATSSLAGDGSETAKSRQNLLAELRDKGVTFPFVYVGEVLGNPSGGSQQGAVYEAALKAGVQFDLDVLLGWKGATLLVTGLYPHGPSLTDNYVHDFNVLSNIDAYDSVRLYEAWFQQEFGDGFFSVRLGWMLADYEFFLSDSTALFLNSAFGAIPGVSQNVEAPFYPVAAPGVRLRLSPRGSLSMQFAAFAGDIGGATTSNRHGTYFPSAKDGALLLGEIAYRTNPPARLDVSERPLSGLFKMGGYYATDDEREATEGSEPIANYALYGIADQEIWHEPGDPSQGLSVFGRVGGTPGERSTVTFYVDGGFNYRGPLPLRDKDIFGIGLSYTKLNNGLLGDDGFPVPSKHETIIEVTYLVAITGWLYVQPDFQYIFNPGATDALPDAVVAGVRFGITF